MKTPYIIHTHYYRKNKRQDTLMQLGYLVFCFLLKIAVPSILPTIQDFPAPFTNIIDGNFTHIYIFKGAYTNGYTTTLFFK